MTSHAWTLRRDIGASLQAGHPWVFRDVLPRTLPGKDGDVVDLFAPDGTTWLARGVGEPSSALTFRVWTRKRGEALDAAFLERRIRDALALRQAVVSPAVNGLRLCHGENDALPGLQCDRYGEVLSLRTDGRAGLAWEDRFADALHAVAGPLPILSRNPHAADGKARVLRGAPPARCVIDEGGRRFHVDLMTGQKTGFFLDQRENRDLVQSISAGLRVLNLFAYTGGFSVAAALGGAARVETVDIAPEAVEVARENFSLNGIPPQAHGFVCADAFDVLAAAAERPGEYDLIIVDPPSFAPNRKSRPRAMRAYARLNELALRALPPGGWLATASCSSHVSEADFIKALSEAQTRTGRQLVLATVRGAGADHPVLPGFPEGRYLQFALGRVSHG